MAMWILVCDASRAVLYSADRRGQEWQAVGAYQHPESRLKNSQLSPSEPGHAAKSKGTARHTALQPDTSPKEAEFEHFAQQLADVLSAGHKQQKFDGAVLVAPPHFLGLLRARLSTEVEKRVVASIDQDYASFGADEVRSRLETKVFGPEA